jgi:hypothetical protein
MSIETHNTTTRKLLNSNGGNILNLNKTNFSSDKLISYKYTTYRISRGYLYLKLFTKLLKEESMVCVSDDGRFDI